MKVSDEVATLSKEINAWMQTFPREDRPRIHSAEVSLLIHYTRELGTGDILVEIGTGWGGSTAIFTKVCNSDVGIYTIDSGSNFQRFGPRDDTTYNDFIAKRFEMYGVPEGAITWIQADSTKVSWEKPIDLLFVDGAHSYEGVRGDIENMIPHVISNGIVIFHDYHMKGVKQAVDEFLEETGLTIENRAHAAVAVRIREAEVKAKTE